jgi:hypothetical protein
MRESGRRRRKRRGRRPGPPEPRWKRGIRLLSVRLRYVHVPWGLYLAWHLTVLYDRRDPRHRQLWEQTWRKKHGLYAKPPQHRGLINELRFTLPPTIVLWLVFPGPGLLVLWLGQGLIATALNLLTDTCPRVYPLARNRRVRGSRIA